MSKNSDELTAFQVNVLSDLAYGLTLNDIAVKHDITRQLVDSCLKELYARFSAATRQNLVAKAFIQGCIDESTFAAAIDIAVNHPTLRQTSCFP